MLLSLRTQMNLYVKSKEDSMKKTIEQRAEEFANIGVQTGIEKAIQYTYKYAATEQCKIDIDKACKWMKSSPLSDYLSCEMIEDFKKIMEEE